MGKLVGYLSLSILAAGWCGWYLSLRTEGVGIVGVANLIGSILFFGSGWWVLRKNLRNSGLVLVGLLAWYVAVVGLGMAGFFSWRPLLAPNIVLAFIILLIAGKKLLSIESFQGAVNATPLERIFLVQTFRVMGVGFLSLYMMGVLPGQFAIPTGVGDVVVGVTAPIVAYIYRLGKSWSKKVALIWNYVGIVDLGMAIALGLLTYPEPLRVVATEVSNKPIALYPLVIIPVFAVPFSILLHIWSIRALRRIR